MADAIRLDLANTPEKFRPTVDEILSQLTEFLEELGRLEDQYFVQQTRLHRKGRVISFKDGIREEITDDQELKEKFKKLYCHLIDPHCTLEMLAQRRDCLHGEHYPSFFNCLHTGCTIVFTMKSANKATIELLPDDGAIPYDMTDPDTRYVAESFINKPPYFHSYFQKYRFIMKHSEESWKIDAVYCGGLHETRWRREYYF